MEKIKSFVDLMAWQKGHKLVLKVYNITDDFPRKEIYGLSDQMRRCAVSITSNIAEGFSRQTSREKNQFYHISLGSISELQNQLLISRDLKYITKEKFNELAEGSVVTKKLLLGLIKVVKNTKYQILNT